MMTDLRTFENSETDSRASAPAARGGEDNALDAPTREPLASAQACQRANHNDTATTRVDLALDEGAAEVLKVGELRLVWALVFISLLLITLGPEGEDWKLKTICGWIGERACIMLEKLKNSRLEESSRTRGSRK